MNKLSWFLYGADVLNNLGILCAAVSILGGIALALTTLCFFATANSYERDTHEVAAKIVARWRFWCIWFFFLLLAVVCPSPKTMYLIAASESAEVIVQSQEAKDTFVLLKETLRKAVEDTKW